MGLKFTNDAESVLSSDISDAATSITVASGTGALFPVLGAGDYFYATLLKSSGIKERIKVTARSSDTFTIVRAQDGTSAAPFSAGDVVAHRVTAATMEDILSASSALPIPVNTEFLGAYSSGTGEYASRTAAEIKSDLGGGTTGITLFGASSVSSAQQTLDLEVGVDVQAYDPDTLKADTSDVLNAGYYQTVTTITDAATPTISLNSSNLFLWTLGANRTFPNITPTTTGMWVFKIYGDYTLAFDGAYDVYGDVHDNASGYPSLVVFFYDGTNKEIYVTNMVPA